MVKGDRGQVGYAKGPGDTSIPVIMIDQKLSFEDAVQQAVQEISNATVKEQLDWVTGLAREGKISEEQYVRAIERGEFIGAQASFLVMAQAKRGGAAWAKDKPSRWKAEEIESFDKYFAYLQRTGATDVYRQRFRNLRPK